MFRDFRPVQDFLGIQWRPLHQEIQGFHCVRGFRVIPSVREIRAIQGIRALRLLRGRPGIQDVRHFQDCLLVQHLREVRGDQAFQDDQVILRHPGFREILVLHWVLGILWHPWVLGIQAILCFLGFH